MMDMFSERPYQMRRSIVSSKRFIAWFGGVVHFPITGDDANKITDAQVRSLGDDRVWVQYDRVSDKFDLSVREKLARNVNAAQLRINRLIELRFGKVKMGIYTAAEDAKSALSIATRHARSDLRKTAKQAVAALEASKG